MVIKIIGKYEVNIELNKDISFFLVKKKKKIILGNINNELALNFESSKDMFGIIYPIPVLLISINSSLLI